MGNLRHRRLKYCTHNHLTHASDSGLIPRVFQAGFLWDCLFRALSMSGWVENLRGRGCVCYMYDIY